MNAQLSLISGLSGQAEILGNGALLYGPVNISCVATATLVSKTKVIVSPTTLIAGSTASIEVTPQVVRQILP